MAMRTAGTSSSLERRRRLMSADELAESESILNDFGITGCSQLPDRNAPIAPEDRLLARLISRRLWKHGLVIGLLWAMLLLPALPLDSVRRLFADSPTGFEDAALRTSAHAADTRTAAVWQPNRLMEGTAGVLLLLSGQLCLLIFAARSRSTVDFRGRYHAWSWLALLLLICSAVVITDTFQLVSHGVAAGLEPLTGTLQAARPALILVPGILILALVVSRIVADMGSCRVSQLLFLLGLLVGVAALLARTERGAELAGIRGSLLLLQCTGGLIFSSCLLHSRFVLHINPDPPAVVRLTAIGDAAAARPVSGTSASGTSAPGTSATATLPNKTKDPEQSVADCEGTDFGNLMSAADSAQTTVKLPVDAAAAAADERPSAKKQKRRKAG